MGQHTRIRGFGAGVRAIQVGADGDRTNRRTFVFIVNKIHSLFSGDTIGCKTCEYIGDRFCQFTADRE